MKKLAAIAIVAASFATLPVANAVMLEGDVNYTGDFTLAPGATGFNNSPVINILLAAVSSTTNGDFASVFGMNFPDLLDHATPIDIEPPTGAYSPLWSFDAGGGNMVSFYLESYNVTQRTGRFLDLNGTGYFLATGFDQTPGSWNLSAQLETGQVTATYSASSIVVPEPGSLALIGLGLLGLGFVGRRKA
jgi:hypothetical protein